MGKIKDMTVTSKLGRRYRRKKVNQREKEWWEESEWIVRWPEAQRWPNQTGTKEWEERRNGRDDEERVETTQNRTYGGKQVGEVAMKEERREEKCRKWMLCEVSKNVDAACKRRRGEEKNIKKVKTAKRWVVEEEMAKLLLPTFARRQCRPVLPR